MKFALPACALPTGKVNPLPDFGGVTHPDITDNATVINNQKIDLAIALPFF